MFALFRHPVDRINSLFYYLQNATWERTYAEKSWANMTLAEYASSDFVESNWMVRFLVDKPEGMINEHDLEEAKRIIRERTWVGLQTSLLESITKFGKLFGWVRHEKWSQCVEKVINKPSNHNRHPPIDPTSDEWYSIQAANALDMKLWAYVHQIYNQQKQIDVQKLFNYQDSRSPAQNEVGHSNTTDTLGNQEMLVPASPDLVVDTYQNDSDKIAARESAIPEKIQNEQEGQILVTEMNHDAVESSNSTHDKEISKSSSTQDGQTIVAINEENITSIDVSESLQTGDQRDSQQTEPSSEGSVTKDEKSLKNEKPTLVESLVKAVTGIEYAALGVDPDPTNTSATAHVEHEGSSNEVQAGDVVENTGKGLDEVEDGKTLSIDQEDSAILISDFGEDSVNSNVGGEEPASSAFTQTTHHTHEKHNIVYFKQP